MFITTLWGVTVLVKLVAKIVADLVPAIEAGRSGMRYIEAATETKFIDGVWTQDELPRVLKALHGGDKAILRYGQERIEALKKGGCPWCQQCGKLYPSGIPEACSRCGAQLT